MAIDRTTRDHLWQMINDMADNVSEEYRRGFTVCFRHAQRHGIREFDEKGYIVKDGVSYKLVPVGDEE